MINDIQSQLDSYLAMPLVNYNQIFKIADTNKSNAFMPFEKIRVALDSTEPNQELYIIAIGQQHNEKFKLKYTVSTVYLETSTFSGDKIIDQLCKEKVKEMRLELAKRAYYDTFNISIYLNDDIIGSMLIDNASIDSEIY